MLDRELQDIHQVISGSNNPEIHHYQHGSHPGIQYYIKTVMPGPDIVNNDTYTVWRAWQNLEHRHPLLIVLVHSAYDWYGNEMPGWWTIWLNERIDIKWTFTRKKGFDYEIVEFGIGIKASGKTSVDSIKSLLQSDASVSYEELEEIAEFLKSYTSDTVANTNRSNLTVIENDQIHDEASDRDELDPKRRR